MAVEKPITRTVCTKFSVRLGLIKESSHLRVWCLGERIFTTNPASSLRSDQKAAQY